MFDTGASCSLIDTTVIKKLGLTHKINRLKRHEVIGAFSNVPQRAEGEIVLKFTIGSQLIQHTFLVATLADPEHMVLGNDFLLKQKEFSAQYVNGEAELKLNGQSVPVNSYFTETETVQILRLDPNIRPKQVKEMLNVKGRVFRYTRVNPEQNAVIKLKLPDTAIEGQHVLVELSPHAEGLVFPDQYKKVYQGFHPRLHNKICKDHTCSGCMTYKYVYIRVKNVSGKYMNLEMNAVIAMVSQASKAKHADVRRAFYSKIKEDIHFADPERIKRILLIDLTCRHGYKN